MSEKPVKFHADLPLDMAVVGPTSSWKALYRWLEQRDDVPKRAELAVSLIRGYLEKGPLNRRREEGWVCYPCESGEHRSCECKCPCRERVVTQQVFGMVES